MKTLIFSALLATTASLAGVVSAATLSFDNAANQGGGAYTEGGFSFDDIRIVS